MLSGLKPHLHARQTSRLHLTYFALEHMLFTKDENKT